ncbi:MAG: sulfotransferase [Proteobacteria bacterium]|nr:sulfotransferase [Pseudomonadota bacterium]
MQDGKLKNQQMIIISGRFRSGTSMLWNIFNNLPQYCAWYEPLHPNLLTHINFVKPKKDHIGIDDYWENYSALKNINTYYSPRFGQQFMYLEKHDSYPELKRYIQFLIDNSGDKTPVLQFNRIDLRLPWIKNNFPNATLITIARDSFALWKSTRKHIKTSPYYEHESFPDAYDLLQWSVELAKKFPMLQAQNNRSGYYRYFFIWKLTSMLAKANADIRLNLENDFLHTYNGVDTLAKKFNWDKSTQNVVNNLIKKPTSMQQPLQKDTRHLTTEGIINKEFEDLGLVALFPSNNLSTIKKEYCQAWQKYQYNPELDIQELLDAMRHQKDELTNLLEPKNT